MKVLNMISNALEFTLLRSKMYSIHGPCSKVQFSRTFKSVDNNPSAIHNHVDYGVLELIQSMEII